ncbi:MAG: hypothetical protein ACLFWB_08045 [Armatimonadota bacterium]
MVSHCGAFRTLPHAINLWETGSSMPALWMPRQDNTGLLGKKRPAYRKRAWKRRAHIFADIAAWDRAVTLWINQHHHLVLDFILQPVSLFGDGG